jgi:SAM-dependent methyltransferase
MSQVTSGLRAVLSAPLVYRTQQFLWGSSLLHAVTRSYLALKPGQSLLDVGCGTCDILKSLPNIHYTGVDLSPSYIERAQARFGDRGQFLVGNIYELEQIADRKYDAVLAQGVLHHLDDDEVTAFVRFAATKLSAGGKLVTADPCFRDGQGRFERFLAAHDRGQNVRTPEAYCKLAQASFGNFRCELRRDAQRLPYTFCYVIATA